MQKYWIIIHEKKSLKGWVSENFFMDREGDVC